MYPDLLLIEDLDSGLHPNAQKTLLEQVRRVLEADPGLQIVATTHSPYLLDHLKYEEVFVSSLLPDGTAACAPLLEQPDLQRWKAEMWPGEFWSSVGEKWVDELEKSRPISSLTRMTP